MLTFFNQILSSIRGALGEIFVALSRIEIDENSPNRVVLNVNTKLIVADKLTAIISTYGRSIVRFENIEAIEIKHFSNGRRFEWWVVVLKLRGMKTIQIGKTIDGALASMVAAHLSTITGKEVRAQQGYGI